jgi:phage baseplate assembly protein W
VAIKITNLEALAKQVQTKKYIYKDLYLDVQKQKQYNTILEKSISKNDLEATFDLDAIIVSLRNLFTTKPGQRFLFPRYGLDLRPFLFQPVNHITSRELSQVITDGIKLYEPRVNLKQLEVIEDPDNNLYNINIVIELPIFNTINTINSVLDVKTQKFTFIKA